MTLRGQGRLLRESDGSVALGDLRYELLVTEPSHGRLGSVSGAVTNKHFVELSDLVIAGEPLILELEDGRRWPCWAQSTDGKLAPRGGIQAGT